ncbi:MAG: hypothetical protein ACOX0K_10280 [Oscillospiraceae bacterium]
MFTPVGIHRYSDSSAGYDAKAKATQPAEQQQPSPVSKTDTFVKSPQYKPNLDKVNAMKADLANNVSAFRMMVQGLFQKQGTLAEHSINTLLEIDEATQAQAQQAVSEDGEWGVEQTALRIVEFAKAISGGDPSKIEALREAVKEGFAAAEKVWGDTLPEICYQTLNRVMEEFDQWAAEETEKA